jgi:hypothetical protein
MILLADTLQLNARLLAISHREIGGAVIWSRCDAAAPYRATGESRSVPAGVQRRATGGHRMRPRASKRAHELHWGAVTKSPLILTQTIS